MAVMVSLAALALLGFNSACDTTLDERNQIRANVLAELEKNGYVHANPHAVAAYANGPDSRPSKDFGFAMNLSGSSASFVEDFYQMYSQKDVILHIGCSPPQGAWYFGCTEYLDSFALSASAKVFPGTSKVAPTGMFLGPFASMGDTMNQLDMRATGANFWDSTYVMITTADETAAVDIANALRLVAPQLRSVEYNTQIVPSLLSPKISIGSGAGHSVFTTGCRLAPAALDRWDANIRDAVAKYLAHQEPVLYLDGTKRLTEPRPYSTPPLKRRGRGTLGEQSLKSAFEELQCLVKQKAFDMGFVQATEQYETALELMSISGGGHQFYINGTRCILDGGACAQDTQDALYTTGSVPLGANNMQVVIGINHRLSGMATYGYVTIGGNFSVDDRQSEGSAEPWAPDFNHADVFTVLTLRPTAKECTEMPSDLEKWCYSVSADPVGFDERAYLDPVTKTGPAASDLLRTKVLRFSHHGHAHGNERPNCGPVALLV